MARKDVNPGCIFAVEIGAGLGTKRYGALGQNGKYASFNIGTGNLSFTPVSKGSKRVRLVGAYNFDLNLFPPHKWRKVRRDAVGKADVFKPGDGKGEVLYAQLGKNKDGKQVSENLVSRDYAIAKSGTGMVTVVGIYKIVQTLI